MLVDKDGGIEPEHKEGAVQHQDGQHHEGGIVAHGDADRCDERHDEYVDGIHGDADVFQDGHDKAHDQDEHIGAEAFKERRQVGGEQSRESCRGQKAADGAREKDDEENLHGDIIEHFIDRDSADDRKQGDDCTDQGNGGGMSSEEKPYDHEDGEQSPADLAALNRSQFIVEGLVVLSGRKVGEIGAFQTHALDVKETDRDDRQKYSRYAYCGKLPVGDRKLSVCGRLQHADSEKSAGRASVDEGHTADIGGGDDEHHHDAADFGFAGFFAHGDEQSVDDAAHHNDHGSIGDKRGKCR